MEVNIETMSLSDLMHVKSIIEKRLETKEAMVRAIRGKDYEEYCRRLFLFQQDEYHEKLKRVEKRIEEFVKAV